jgi:trimeric autotransporter adhesin
MNKLFNFKFSVIAIIIMIIGCLNINAQIIDPNGDGGFENGVSFAANGWTVANGTATNQWFVGSAPALTTGTSSAFISPDGGVNNTYTNTSASVVHFWRDVTIPAGQIATLSFNWWALGETSFFDGIMVSIAPTSFTPTATNTSLGTGLLAAPAVNIAQLWTFSTVQTANIVIPANVINNCAAPSTFRLIFTWKNDGSGGINPSGAIDNISLTAAVAPAPLSGTLTVGPTGTYATVVSAVNDINSRGVSGPVVLEIQSTYSGAGETFPITLAGQGNCFPLTSVNNVTIRPEAGSPILTISGTNAGPTFDVNGGQWWRIDGRPGGVGTNKNLIIVNTSTSGQAIRFINEGSNNIIRHCDVRGVNTSTTSGVILFSTTTGDNGNDNNLIDNSDIRDGATTPLNGIYSSGTTTSVSRNNSNNTVSNCNIFNTFGATSTSYGINLVGGNNFWTISGNSIYQTISRSSSTIWGGVQISNTASGDGFLISNNFIGGTAPLCGGTPLTFTGTTINFRGMNLLTGTTQVSVVNNNVIQNINITSTQTSTFNGGIIPGSGLLNITNNTIGSTTVAGSITITASGSGYGFSGIIAGGSTPNSLMNITGNSIGGINMTVTGTPATVPILRPISITGASATHNYNVSNNTIGSTTIPNSITLNGNSGLIGIISFSNAIGQNINNNTIANLSNPNTGTGASCYGITAQGSGASPNFLGSFTIEGNTIRDLTTGSSATFISALGLNVSGTAQTIGSTQINGNIIHSISNTNATAASIAFGANFVLSPLISNVVSKNFIHSIGLSTTAAGIIAGMQVTNGLTSYSNNIIRVGVDAAGSQLNGPYTITGIVDVTGFSSYYHNSVYIGGNAVSTGASNSFAFNSSVVTNSRNYINNIFYNARSNTGATGKHYAIRVGGTTANPAGLFSNYNDLLVSGTGGFVGLFNGVDQATIADWRTATGNDANSISADPMFVSPNGTSATVDLHISTVVPTSIESGGQGVPSVTEDYDGQLRSGLTPVDIGADAGNFILLDISAPGIGYTPLTAPCGTGDISLNGVMITDGTGIPLMGANIPRIYFRKNAGTYTSAAGILSSGNANNSTWNFTISAAALGGLASGDIIDYYVIAQDNAALPNIGSNPGGVVATDVNTIITHPIVPNSIVIPVIFNGGIYTVGVGGDYTTLTAAVSAYNAGCLSGSAVFSLIDPTYPGETFPITINQVNGASSVNTLTIKPSSGNNPVISGSSATAIMVLNGADWVVLDGSNGTGINSLCPLVQSTRNLTLINTSTSTSSAVVWLQTQSSSNPAANNSIKNCNISGNGPSQTLFGIGSGSTTIGTASIGLNNNNNIFENNNIFKCQYAIFSSGTSLAFKNQNNIIRLNQVNTTAPDNVGVGGILANFENNLSVAGNVISGMSQTTSPDVGGINLGFGANGFSATSLGANECSNVNVSNNIIGSVTNSGTFSAIGIGLAASTTGTSLISNNMIYGVASNGTAGDFSSGILLGGGIGSTTNVYHNTVVMQGSIQGATAASQVSSALSVTATIAPSLDLKNNNFVNTQLGNPGASLRLLSIGLGYSSTAGSYANLFSNNNNLFANGAGPGTYAIGATGGVVSGTLRTNIANWQAETGTDANSINVNPVFIASNNVHLEPNATENIPLLCAGINIPILSTDIDCETRKSKPTIGADEIPVNVPAAIAILETSGTTNNDGIICQGASATLTASGGVIYLWSTGQTNASISVTLAGTYTITVTDAGGCIGSTSAVVIVNPLPAPSIVITETSGLVNNDGIICQGASATLTASGGGTYLWSTGATTASITTGSAGSYTVTVTNLGCSASTSSSISVNPLPVSIITITESSGLSNNDGIICAGTNATLTANGGGSYAWSTGSTMASIVVSTTGLYTVTVTNLGCNASTSSSITVNPLPTAGITGTFSACVGSTVTLNGTGGTQYLWSTSETTSSINVVMPAAPSVIAITVTDVNGCTAAASQGLTPLFVPIITPTITQPTTCVSTDGAISTVVSNATNPTYIWSNGSTTTGISGIPVGNYTVTVTSDNTCSSTAVINLSGPGGCSVCPSIGSLNVSSPLCANTLTTLTASGLSDMGVTYGISFVSFPAATATPYTGGTVIATVPNASLTGGGTTAIATASIPAGTYVIYAILLPTPTDPSCTPSASANIIINPAPTVTITVTETSGITNNDGIICAGASATLTATGGGTFLWSTGANTASITTGTAGTYTVTVTALGCSASTSSTITVNPLPTPIITVTETSGVANNDGIICAGASATLTATGGGTYLWSTGATTAGITTGTAGTYTVTVTVLGCTASTSRTITVNPLPSPVITVTETSGVANNDGIICAGASATLNATGGGTYLWSTGATTAGITTGTAGTYTVTVTVLGCSASTSSTITVNPLPTPIITVTETSGVANNDGIICAGASATLTATGGGTYLWSTGATTAGITTGTAGTYTVTVTVLGCTASTSRTITVNPIPTPVITVTDISGTTNNDGIICQGATATLTASGGTSYLWSNGATTAGITTGVAGTYTVTVTSNGCSASTSRTITVNPNPIASISLAETSGPVDNDGMIYEGAVVYLTASGGGTYAWSTGATTANIIVTPMVTTTYTVTVTNANGCTATASRIITVEPNVCLLVCSGNQNITLPGGVCEYQVPNLVTKTGICEDLDIIPPPLVGFTGAFAYANRYFHSVPQGSDPAYGNLPCTNITGMPNQLVLQSADVLSGGNTCNYFGTVVTWTVPANGTISFNWATQTNDPTWDNFGYSLTNDPNTPTGLFFGTLQTTTTVLADVTASGMVTIPVTAGQRFSLVTYTEDGFGGPLTATINNFRFQEAQVTLPWTIVQTAGPTPGSFVGAGTYQLCYELLDPRGRVTDQCCFTITVGNFPTPTRSLVCNNHINISADQNCQVFLNADMFLEGGPYGCYNSYQINIWPFNSQANAINNIPHNVGLNLPTGNHTYEIVDPVTGNKCWGTFTVEDKIAPVVTCNCQDIDIPTPVTQFAGSLTATDPVFDRCGFTGFGTWPYDVYQFQVSTTGSYTFTANSPAGDTYAYINANTFDPANPCLGNIAQNDDGAGGLDPLITINLTAGVTYYYIFTNWSPFDAPSGPYTVNITGPGQIVTIVNPSEDPACQFACYDIEVVKRETVGMLYNIPGQNANRSKLTTPPVAIDACGPVSRTFEDRITSTNCGASKLIRDWKFTDAMGNTTFCSQTFTFNQITVFDLTVPTRDVNLTCGLDASPAAIAGYTDVDSRPQPASTTNIGIYADDWAQTPTVVELHEGNVNGYFTYPQIGFDGNFHPQKVDNGVCNIYTSYTDQMINACGIGCGGNMKVIRTWTILDWCTGDVFTYIQVIKATDEKAPTFFVKDHTISVDPWGCLANWTVDQPWELQDNCAKSEELKWGVKVPAGVTLSGTQPNYTLTGMPKGRHAITYWASDCCGNVSEVVAFVTVIDASAPVAVAKQNIVMSLTGSGTGADGAGKIYGWQIDNGSYDHCTPVKFEVRRLSGGACGNLGANGTHNNNSTYNDNNGFTSEVPGRVWFHPNDNAQDTDGGEFVKFCCEDIPAGSDHGLHEVEMRVWDDGNMNGIYGDNEIIDGMKDNYNTTWVTIRVENKLPPTLVCPPDVTVTCDMELNLSLDADTPVSAVNLTMTGYPKAFDLCSNLDITYRDAWIGANDPICKKGTIRRTFKVTKGSVVVTCPQFITVTTITAPFTVTFPQNNGTTAWDKCTFSLEDARDASNPTIKKPIVNYGQCDIVGENIKIDTFLFEDGACKKWRVEYTYINWCAPAGQNTLGGFVHYYTYKDEIAPVLTCTNQMFAANPNPANPNGGCEASVILEASATDALVCADESWVKWQGFFDGWADGTVDRLASSFVNKSWNGIWVPQARLIAGQPNPTWIALQNQHPNAPLADLVFVTYVAPSKASGGTVKLPAFILDAENISHKVLWKVTDGCGNVDQCESTVMVVDKKAPTPYCVSISTALMQGTPGMVELWAKDFDKGAFDNCSPQSKLYFTFDGVAPIYARVNEEHFYKAGANGSVNATATEYAQGRAYKWLPSMRSAGKVWTAAGTFNVNVDVWDEAWNTDYCTVVLTIRGPQGSRISGHIATEDNQGVFNTQVIATASLPDYPKVDMTNASGDYAMDIVVDTELKALKDGDDINGVSTIDLVMIQRHILGLQALNSPYKLIAADANNDGKVTASDLTEIRKLILGVTNEFSNNNSWRFPVKDQTMDAQSPFPYTENMMASVSDPNPSYDFVAVKIGDVNGSVVTNINNPSVEGRSNSNVVMTVADAVVAAGEVVEIPVTAANFSDVAGFQYTMNLEGASFVGINSGAIEMTANNVGVLANGVVTMSYASNEAVSVNEGEVLFTLVVRTDKATTVSEVLSMSSDVTKAESYNSDLKVGNVSLNVRTAPVASIELFQNEPNPWKGQTTVSFHMPVAATATLSVYDVTGKVVTVRNIDAAKGLNSEVFTKEQLGVSGVLYYTLVSGEFTATKKMIIVE